MIRAQQKDLDKINTLYMNCINDLNRKKIFQWDEKYPNKQTFETSISNQQLFIFEEDKMLIGAVILNEIQAEEWQAMPWKSNGSILAIHALAINCMVQSRGYGQKVLDECEIYGIQNGYNVMRLDAFSENIAAINLYEKNLYQRVGEVVFNYKPKGHQRYYCYEKLLIK